MPGLSAKVFRTYRSSKLLYDEIKIIRKNYENEKNSIDN
jgi:hypothetical protein